MARRSGQTTRMEWISTLEMRDHAQTMTGALRSGDDLERLGSIERLSRELERRGVPGILVPNRRAQKHDAFVRKLFERDSAQVYDRVVDALRDLGYLDVSRSQQHDGSDMGLGYA